MESIFFRRGRRAARRDRACAKRRSTGDGHVDQVANADRAYGGSLLVFLRKELHAVCVHVEEEACGQGDHWGINGQIGGIPQAVAYREQGQFQQALEVLKRTPGESFEIAFNKATLLLVWNAQKERMGESIDTTAAIASIKEALRIGAQPVPEVESSIARNVGVHIEAERNEMMEVLRQSLTELQR